MLFRSPVSALISTHLPCAGNADDDTDVDGKDIHHYLSDTQDIGVSDFALNFGRTDCNYGNL